MLPAKAAVRQCSTPLLCVGGRERACKAFCCPSQNGALDGNVVALGMEGAGCDSLPIQRSHTCLLSFPEHGVGH